MSRVDVVNGHVGNDESEDGEEYDDDEENPQGRGLVQDWIPPGADEGQGDGASKFGMDFEDHFFLPERLADKSSALVDAVNDFHFAMMNDLDRNEFYAHALQNALVRRSHACLGPVGR